ncbi:hypothetical protein CK203_111592 [Vitis vinifera]|uniref:Uncharacterized protein n=1 Tax=Vitis vinifera TaxID=29760 RepID=A0A438FD56_VITVI|nr:hypothetical protein CK203_111592 [Vitis vinifera]
MGGEDYYAWRERMSSPLTTTRDDLKRRCDVSSIGTSSTRNGEATMHIRNPKGSSRPPIRSSYVGMALLAAKVAASCGPGYPSSARLCQLTAG